MPSTVKSFVFIYSLEFPECWRRFIRYSTTSVRLQKKEDPIVDVRFAGNGTFQKLSNRIRGDEVLWSLLLAISVELPLLDSHSRLAGGRKSP